MVIQNSKKKNIIYEKSNKLPLHSITYHQFKHNPRYSNPILERKALTTHRICDNHKQLKSQIKYRKYLGSMIDVSYTRHYFLRKDNTLFFSLGTPVPKLEHKDATVAKSTWRNLFPSHWKATTYRLITNNYYR
jgi:hypothetical protein